MEAASAGKVCPRCRRNYDGETRVCAEDNTPLVPPNELVGTEDDPMLGRTLANRFTILSKLGAGSMGTVYRARQHAIGRDVAIKILRSDRANDENAKARFLREARANSLLASPHTVTVYDFGQSETGEFFLAMEMLEGESLGQRLARVQRLSVEEAVDTTRQALRSLAEAHAKGIIHRDLKPDNLFFARVKQGEDGRSEELVKVLDFGIAKMISGSDKSALNAIETQAGTVFGTPRYMSPEQAQGKTLDVRSDLYSLAVILYQMVTGRPPFTDNDAIVVMARHIKTPPRLPTEACPEARIPLELENALMRALSKEPEGRPASAEQMSQELARAIEPGAASSSGVRSVGPSTTMEAHAGLSAPVLDITDDDVDTVVAPNTKLYLRKRRTGPLLKMGLATVVVASIALAIFVYERVHRDDGAAARPAKPALAPPEKMAEAPANPPSSTSKAKGPDNLPTISAESLPKASPVGPVGVRPPLPAQKAPRSGPAAPARSVKDPAASPTAPAPSPAPAPPPSSSSTYQNWD